jgi:hypothetical protein
MMLLFPLKLKQDDHRCCCHLSAYLFVFPKEKTRIVLTFCPIYDTMSPWDGGKELPMVAEIKGIVEIIDDLNKKSAKQAEHLTELVQAATERWKQLPETEREEFYRSAAYQKPHPYKYWGTCEICGEQFGAWRSDKQTCEKWACRKTLYRQKRKLGLGSHQANLKGFK